MDVRPHRLVLSRPFYPPTIDCCQSLNCQSLDKEYRRYCSIASLLRCLDQAVHHLQRSEVLLEYRLSVVAN
jgi:hypothetical protein